jgi:ribosomal protein S18 acetylase RimI-like enzyme
VNFDIAAGGLAEIDELKSLWLQMLSHHRSLIDGALPIHTDEQSWERARRDYRDWLESEAAIVLIARSRPGSEPVGYAVCRLRPGGATFDLGAMRGEVDSLVVQDQARGRGIGTALLDGVRSSLLERGIGYWSIGVLADNAQAAKLYERIGFRPWTQELIATTRTR